MESIKESAGFSHPLSGSAECSGSPVVFFDDLKSLIVNLFLTRYAVLFDFLYAFLLRGCVFLVHPVRH